jgi:hypothetical protein
MSSLPGSFKKKIQEVRPRRPRASLLPKDANAFAVYRRGFRDTTAKPECDIGPIGRQGEWPRQARRAAVLAAALAATALRAKARDDDIAAGHAFAREARRACHIVEAEESSPREFRNRAGVLRHCERPRDDGGGPPGLPD